MYADDHQFYHAGRVLPTAISKLRLTETATKWYDLNLLAGNLKKYQTLIIDNNPNHENSIEECVIFVNKEKINTTETLQLLGVTIDSKLNFNNHISIICKKARQRIGVLIRLRNLIPTDAKSSHFTIYLLPSYMAFL